MRIWHVTFKVTDDGIDDSGQRLYLPMGELVDNLLSDDLPAGIKAEPVGAGLEPERASKK